MGIQILLIVVSIFLEVSYSGSNQYIANNDIKVNGIGLVIKNKNNEFEYKNYAYATYKNKPIYKNTEINGQSLQNQSIYPSNFLNYSWYKGEVESNSKTNRLLNLENQWVNLFRFYNSKVLNSIDLQPKLVGIHNKSNKFSEWNFEFGVSNNEILNNPDNVGFDDYLLTLNNGAEIFKDEHYLSEINTLNSHSSGILNSKLFEKSIKLPIYEMNEDKQWKVQNFDNIIEFAKYYFSPKMVKNAYLFIEKLDNKVQHNNINSSSFYSSIIMTYLYKQNQIQTLKNQKLGTKLIKEYTNMSFQFQYWTYLTLQLIFENNLQKNIDFEILNTLFNVLDYDLKKPDKRITSHLAIVDNPNMFESQFKVVKPISNPLSISLKKNYQTISIVTLKTPYDYKLICLSWITIGFIFSFVGLAFLNKKDIS